MFYPENVIHTLNDWLFFALLILEMVWRTVWTKDHYGNNPTFIFLLKVSDF
jgi:hypothetical protein